ncbi:hypothetical protein PSACC_02755 [Paramicrosporidium saccamoebae]|uniref:Uncharacterized protein n=1 Tax=Paramicrosporidium saccamoebae TaxID=1246581 RepID=A0A2H9TI72_9FUNG|nr:hypothetical protein PSACC_02755 [Paramicrosporidium saccamoebae]
MPWYVFVALIWLLGVAYCSEISVILDTQELYIDDFDSWKAQGLTTIDNVHVDGIATAYLFRHSEPGSAFEKFQSMLSMADGSIDDVLVDTAAALKECIARMTSVQSPRTILEGEQEQIFNKLNLDRVVEESMQIKVGRTNVVRTREISDYSLHEVELQLSAHVISREDLIRLLWQKSTLIADLDPDAAMQAITDSLDLMKEDGQFVPVGGIDKVPEHILLRLTTLNVLPDVVTKAAETILSLGNIADTKDLAMARNKASDSVKKEMAIVMDSNPEIANLVDPYAIYKSNRIGVPELALKNLVKAYTPSEHSPSGRPVTATDSDLLADFQFVLDYVPGMVERKDAEKTNSRGEMPPRNLENIDDWDFAQYLVKLQSLWTNIPDNTLAKMWSELEPTISRFVYQPLVDRGADAKLFSIVRDVVMDLIERSYNTKEDMEIFLDYLKAALVAWDLKSKAVDSPELEKYQKYIERVMNEPEMKHFIIKELESMTTDLSGDNKRPILRFKASYVNHFGSGGEKLRHFKDILEMPLAPSDATFRETILQSIDTKTFIHPDPDTSDRYWEIARSLYYEMEDWIWAGQAARKNSGLVWSVLDAAPAEVRPRLLEDIDGDIWDALIKSATNDIIEGNNYRRGPIYMQMSRYLGSVLDKSCDSKLERFIGLSPIVTRIISSSTDSLKNYMATMEEMLPGCVPPRISPKVPIDKTKLNEKLADITTKFKDYVLAFPLMSPDEFPITQYAPDIDPVLEKVANDSSWVQIARLGMLVSNPTVLTGRRITIIASLNKEESLESLLDQLATASSAGNEMLTNVNDKVTFIKFLNKLDMNSAKVRAVYIAIVNSILGKLPECTKDVQGPEAEAAMHILPKLIPDERLTVDIYNAAVGFTKSGCAKDLGTRDSFLKKMNDWDYMTDQNPAVGIIWAAFASDPTDTPTNLAHAARMAIKYGAEAFLTVDNLITILNNGRSIATNEGLLRDLSKIPAFAEISFLKAVRAKTEIPLSTLTPREFQYDDTLLPAYMSGNTTFDHGYRVEISHHESDQTQRYQLSGIYPRVPLPNAGTTRYKLCGNLQAEDVHHIELENVRKIQLECLEEMSVPAIRSLFGDEAILENILPPLSENVVKKLGAGLVGQLTDTQYQAMHNSWALSDARHPYRALFGQDMLIDAIMKSGKGPLIEAEAFLIQDRHWLKAFPGAREDVAKKVLANVSAQGFESEPFEWFEYIDIGMWKSFEMAIPNDLNYCRKMTRESHPYLVQTSYVCQLLAGIWPPVEEAHRRTTTFEEVERKREQERLEELAREQERVEELKKEEERAEELKKEEERAEELKREEEAKILQGTISDGSAPNSQAATKPASTYQPPRITRVPVSNTAGSSSGGKSGGKSGATTGESKDPSIQPQFNNPPSGITSIAAPLSIAIAAGSSEEVPATENAPGFSSYFYSSFADPHKTSFSGWLYELSVGNMLKRDKTGASILKSVAFKWIIAIVTTLVSICVLAVPLYYVFFKRQTV